jgi:hypothetical protein
MRCSISNSTLLTCARLSDSWVHTIKQSCMGIPRASTSEGMPSGAACMHACDGEGHVQQALRHTLAPTSYREGSMPSTDRARMILTICGIRAPTATTLMRYPTTELPPSCLPSGAIFQSLELTSRPKVMLINRANRSLLRHDSRFEVSLSRSESSVRHTTVACYAWVGAPLPCDTPSPTCSRRSSGCPRVAHF